MYDGLNQLNKIRVEGRQCMNAKEYDYYSTPSRDKRLFRFFQEVRKIAYEGGEMEEDNVNGQILARSIFHPELPDGLIKELDEFCGLAIYPDNNVKHINLREMWENMEKGKVSSDPHASFDNRWGLTETPHTATCKTY